MNPKQLLATVVAVAIVSMVLVAVTCGAERPPQAPPIDPRLSRVSSDLDAVASKIDSLSAEIKAIGEELAALKKPASLPVVKTAPKPTSVAVDARAGHWSVASASNVWRPSKNEAIAHLRQSHPSKARQYEPLESLSLETLLTLHDDDHEGRTSTVRTAAVSTSAPVVRSPAPAYSSSCPGGVCPTGVSSYGSCPGGNCPTSSRSSYVTGPFGFRWKR